MRIIVMRKLTTISSIDPATKKEIVKIKKIEGLHSAEETLRFLLYSYKKNNEVKNDFSTN